MSVVNHDLHSTFFLFFFFFFFFFFFRSRRNRLGRFSLCFYIEDFCDFLLVFGTHFLKMDLQFSFQNGPTVTVTDLLYHNAPCFRSENHDIQWHILETFCNPLCFLHLTFILFCFYHCPAHVAGNKIVIIIAAHYENKPIQIY